MRFTSQTNYKNRTIINTSAIDYICNNLLKFIK
jgi:hypothetical protein